MRKTFADSKEREQFVGNLVRKIASHFRGSVIQNDNYYDRPGSFLLSAGSEARIWFRYDEYKNRLEVSGSWPQTKLQGTRHNGPMFGPSDCCRGDENVYSSITVDADKSSEKIAADITRRFLPGYLAVFKLCAEARDRHEAYVAAQNSLADELAGLLGTNNRAGYGNRDAAARPFVELPDNVGGVIETSDDTATFTLRSVSADKARKLAAFIKTL